MMKKTTFGFGILAASLIFSQGAFADALTTTTNANTNAEVTATSTGANSTTATTDVTSTTDTTAATDTNTTVTNATYSGKLGNKLDKIESKFDQFKNQKVPATTLLGKYTSVENRVNALLGQMDKVKELQQQLSQLQGNEATQTADTLTALYERVGDLQNAIKVEKEFVKTKLDKKATDADILKEYKELGKLLRKSGKVGVQAVVNGEEPNMDVPPVIDNGRTLLPFRALAESLGAEVSYDPATRTVTVTKGDTKVVLTIDSVTATVNGQQTTLDVPAKVVQGRTLIPLRFLGQSLNARVLWEPETQYAIVIGDEVPPTSTTTTAPATETTTTGTTTESTTGTTAATDDTTAGTTGTTGTTDATIGTTTTGTTTDTTADTTTTGSTTVTTNDTATGTTTDAQNTTTADAASTGTAAQQ